MSTKDRARRPIAVDLFSGAGGLSLGLEQAGFDVVAAVEYDPIHAAIHELNFPKGKTICRDIRKIGGDDIREAAGIGRSRVDLVAGGPPCQGFSLIGHRVLEDSRNELVFHFLRIVKELQPRAFLFENVPGMATGKHHELLDELIGDFEKLGYRVRTPFRILNAKEFGVPQDRRRLILLGSRDGVRVPDYPRPTNLGRDRAGKPQIVMPLSTLEYGPSVRDAIGDLPDIEKFDSLFETDSIPRRLTKASDYALRLRGDLADPEDYSHPRIWAEETLSGCSRAAHTPLSRSRFAATTPGETEPISRFYRLPLEGLCNTLRAGTGSERGAFTSPRPIHPTFPRCISVREAARLHSFPDWFRFHRTIWHGFRQIGNSVPPLLGRTIARSIMTAIGETPVRPIESLEVGEERLAAFTMKDAAEHFGVKRDVIPQRKRSAA